MEMVKFQDMPYERPDFEAMKEAYRQAAEELKNAGSYEEARSICFDMQDREYDRYDRRLLQRGI